MKTYSLLLTFILTIGFHQTLQGQSLPTEGSDLFYGSGNCATCHLPGSPNTSALLDANGHDVSMVTYWRGTMMANAAKDPLWQAKVKAEIDTHPSLQTVIEDKCTTCHAPMGRTEAYYDGALTYTFDEMLADPLAMDGVSCTVCHQIQATDPLDGESFSGHFTITDIRQIFGPYTNPVTNPMITNSNYTPVYAPHISQSELCATCHTLFTPYVNDNATIIGEAPEQTPYLEWLNSDFPAEGTECQTCHVPRITTPITISNRPSSLSPRTPFGKHEFVGGNQYMLKILKMYRTELGVAANDTELDSVIARTQRQLNQHSIALSVESVWNDADELVSVVTVENLTGHKFPTAYPSRRAWLVFTVKDPQGNTVFSSGDWDTSFEITGLDSSYEPHHDNISSEDQIQIYQAIPQDYLGNKTYTLLRIAGYLKDNRIPPRGYSTTGVAADSTAIEGLAASDANFNRDGATEGTGIDLVTYVISGLNRSITYTVEVKMVYQSLAPRYVSDLLTHSGGIPEVDTFAAYYAQVPNEPFTLDSTGVTVTALDVDPSSTLPQSVLIVDNYPNPFNAATRISFYL
ncbi:MAG: hypothetical protein GXO90_08130, partial [FCB group bacterium]|nr:hypothetical protein [FCB group bacterium]